MKINQSRNYKQTWNSLKKCVNMFPPGNGHMNIGYTLQRKSTVYTLQWKYVLQLKTKCLVKKENLYCFTQENLVEFLV